MRYPLTILALTLILLAGSADARTWRIHPDGSGDAATIQAGIEAAASGDTVLVSCGTYTEHDILLSTVGLVVRSESGQPDCVTIDAQRLGRVLYGQGLDATTRIEGFTLTGGSSDRGGGGGFSAASPVIADCLFIDNLSTFVGGGVDCRSESSPAFDHCRFIDNEADWDGGGLYCLGASSPTLDNCEFIGNTGGHSGGGMRCEGPGSDPVLTHCTFSGNDSDFGGGFICYTSAEASLTNCTFSANAAASDGGGLYCGGFGVLTLSRTIVAYSDVGVGVFCESASTATLSCCDLFANAAGDWVGEIAGQGGADGNLGVDPQFCSIQPDADRNWMLQSDSPCAPGNHPQGTDCGVIGAWPVGCGTTPSERSTWGNIKTRFRD